jgi:hypothetical protein
MKRGEVTLSPRAGHDPTLALYALPRALRAAAAEYNDRWESELGDHVSGDPPPFDRVLRAVRREQDVRA